MTQYSGKKNFIKYIQDSTPTGANENDLWYDTINDGLKIFNGSGTWDLTGNVFMPTTADFTVDDDTSVINQTLQFTDQSTGDITDWAWNFGDSNTSTLQSPTHQYTSNGQYDVTLTVTDSGSNQDTKTVINYITVANDPGASFVSDLQTTHINTDITFTDQSTTNGTITAWAWNFGDSGTSTSQNPVHQYTTSGQYTVSLTVTDEFGSDTMTRTNYIAIDVPPVAAFTSDLVAANTNENITFADQSTSFGTITNWAWNFGDSNTSTTQNPVHQYTSGDTYTVSLTVTDEFGNDTETKTDYIVISSAGTGTDYGYSMGGSDGNYTSTIDRITFPFDSGTAAHDGNLSGTRQLAAGCNSSNYGYCMGGHDSGYTSTIDRITFPFDSGTAAHDGNLSGTRQLAAECNSSNYGYCMGGHDSGYTSTIDRITFPFDSGVATHGGNLSGSRYSAAGCNSSNYGYCMGGIDSNYSSTIDRITFPFDSGTAAHGGNLSGTRYYVAGCNSSNYGYCMGGYDNNYLSTIDRITFPFDSGTAAHFGNLSGSRYGGAGCNSSNYGYCMGGYISGATSTIDRITFPFDSGTAAHDGNLSGTRRRGAGCDGTDFATLFV